MGKVYKGLIVPIPPWAHRHRDGKVFDGPGAGRNPNTVLIGYAVTENTMHPNENYKKFHYNEYIKYNTKTESYKFAVLYAGLYLLILGIAQKIGIYQSLASVFGCSIANACMDYSMFLIGSKLNATYLLPSYLKRMVTFTSGPLSDTWYSDYFNDDCNEDKQRIILDVYLKQCVEKGMTSVYLSIDGCNIDCASKSNINATQGDPKSGNKGATIVNFMWVVCAEGEYVGTPITYFVKKGKFLDSQMIREVVTYLKGFGVEVKGVICDRGFCFTDVMKLLEDTGIPYIIMLTSKTMGYNTALERYRDILQSRPLDLYIGNRKYGIATDDKIPIFQKEEVSAYVALFYSPEMADRISLNLIEDAFNEVARIEDNIKRGRRAAVDAKLKNYIEIFGNGKNRKVVFHKDILEEDAACKGYYALACSEPLTAMEIAKIYRMRQASERAYSAFKSQLGCDVLRVHSTESAISKMFFEFVAAIIRNEAQLMCKQLCVNTNELISDLDEVQYIYVNKGYKYTDVISDPVRQLLKAYGINENDMTDFSAEVTRRYVTLPDKNESTLDIFSEFPWKHHSYSTKEKSEQNKTAHEKQEEKNHSEALVQIRNLDKPQDHNTEEKPKRKRRPGGGRKKGSKNKKTIEREERERLEREAEGYVEPEKKKAGRPRGRKDSKPRVRRTKEQIENSKKDAG